VPGKPDRDDFQRIADDLAWEAERLPPGDPLREKLMELADEAQERADEVDDD